MGDIGTERREVEFEPLTGVPAPEPVRAPQPAPAQQPGPAQPEPARQEAHGAW